MSLATRDPKQTHIRHMKIYKITEKKTSQTAKNLKPRMRVRRFMLHLLSCAIIQMMPAFLAVFPSDCDMHNLC